MATSTSGDGLTAKQRRFVAEYLVDSNATRAAIRAGYSAVSADKIGSELLGKTRVSKAVAAKQAKVAEKLEITAEWIAGELKGNHERAHQLGDVPASNKALELLGKHLGMFVEKHEHEMKFSLASLLAQAKGGGNG